MKKITVLLVATFFMVCLSKQTHSSPHPAGSSINEFGQTLEKPAWGMIEWSSATLPKKFWYPSFELTYAHAETYFFKSKEVDFPGGRDSTAYILGGRLLYGLSDKFNLGILVPFVLSQKVDSGMYGQKFKVVSGASNIGDVQLWVKYHFLDRYFWSIASEVGATLPTGTPHNKVSSKEAATGDGQPDLNFALSGDILLTEESFIKLGTHTVYQFKRTYRYQGKELVDEKLGNLLGLDLGFAQNFKGMGLGGALKYNFWQATKVNGEAITGDSNLLNLFLQLSVGDLSPEKQSKLDFTLDVPVSGKNASITYRLGVSLKTIFR
jgi:hypothetical protein